jgi:hypothetical protein
LLIFEEMKNRIIRNYCRDALMLPWK